MTKDMPPSRVLWGRFRFAIIAKLLVAPPDWGALQGELVRLAQQTYTHPITGEPVAFGLSTIQRWLYTARNAPKDPIGALMNELPAHAGTHPSLSLELRQVLRAQHEQHPSWSYQLHYDNLLALARKQLELGRVPSYPTVRRFMKAQGLVKRSRKRRGTSTTVSDERTPREVRSYEVEHVHALWHADFHEGSRRVLLPSGKWAKAMLLAVLDDRSRLCCHAQWYLGETAEEFVHGLIQAMLKRGLPRSVLTDNGSAMTAAETVEGLARLGVLHRTTRPYTPEQNAKAEVFWAQVEGRPLAMLEGERELTLRSLNVATQSWVELEYHRRVHRELGDTPLQIALTAPGVGRPPPDADTLTRAFRAEQRRIQRKSDGTISLGGVRFELPSAYRTLRQVTVRSARWNLSSVELVDGRTGKRLCDLYPQDKRANADGRRRALSPLAEIEDPESRGQISVRNTDMQALPESRGIAPHLQHLIDDYAATGLPPAYLPFADKGDDRDDRDDRPNTHKEDE